MSHSTSIVMQFSLSDVQHALIKKCIYLGIVFGSAKTNKFTICSEPHGHQPFCFFVRWPSLSSSCFCCGHLMVANQSIKKVGAPCLHDNKWWTEKVWQQIRDHRGNTADGPTSFRVRECAVVEFWYFVFIGGPLTAVTNQLQQQTNWIPASALKEMLGQQEHDWFPNCVLFAQTRWQFFQQKGLFQNVCFGRYASSMHCTWHWECINRQHELLIVEERLCCLGASMVYILWIVTCKNTAIYKLIWCDNG